MEINKSWCPLPWKGINIRNNGDYRICCQANTSRDKGILRRADGSPFNAKNADMAEVRNSALLKEVRQAMLRGERHEACVRCNMEDDAGVRSKRAYETAFWREEFTVANAAEHTNADGYLDPKDISVGYYDVRFGNLCNLKCRMCGPADSSFWHKEHFETMGESFSDTSGTVQLERVGERVRVVGEDPYTWHESPDFWRQMEENIHDIRKIYTVGGEPLLIERHYELLQRIVAAGHAPNVIIEYNSNITVIPKRALGLWKEFKEVKIGVSIDGFGKVNEYIRHPSRWEVTEKNLTLLDEAEGNLNVWITATVQIYNIHHLTDFLKWKIEKNFRRVNVSLRSPFITAHPLHTPRYFSIKALPASVKEAVSQKFDSFFGDWFLPYVAAQDFETEKKEHWITSMQKLLAGYKSLMHQEDLSHLLPTFWGATAKMDLYRNESLVDSLPEIALPIREELRLRGHAV